MQAAPLRYGLPVLFGGVLLLCVLDGLFHFFPTVPSVENRAPAQLPHFDTDDPDAYPRDWEAYFEDRFPWRGRFQRFNARLQRITNGRSPLPDLVVLGTDDWYYKGGLQLDIYRGKRRFSPAELAEVTATLSARRDSVAALGGRYVVAVAPLKHHIYPGHLPDYVRPLNPDHATRQLYRALDGRGVEYVDLHQALRTYADTAQQEDLYYRTDHHWTVKAGVVAAAAIQQRLAPSHQRSTGAPPPYYYTSQPTDGMLLAQMAGRARKDQETFYTLHRHGGWWTEEVPRPDIVAPADFPYPMEYAKQRRQINPELRRSLPSLFVTRESFGENLYLPLSEAYGTSFWLFDAWRHGLNLDDYRREGGEVYLQLVWEGFLFNLLREPAEDGRW
ncbi:alginate O-acetyltransferase AlgX-related protein [Neolewinella sp.]|uniref:alginate O-acetyltransferase AlgX-related protein n=1 Tax=Neolewinella sp. TaxID=2993543 RepID=UPI003B52FD6E